MFNSRKDDKLADAFLELLRRRSAEAAAPQPDVHDVLQGTITWDQYHANGTD